MKDYNPATPRAALGLSAVALAAVTLGAMVVLPAKIESVGAESCTAVTLEQASRQPGTVRFGGTRTIVKLRADESRATPKEKT